MAVEKKRGCGYRKVGGLYLAGGDIGEGCHRLPISTEVCRVCNQGIKQTRGLTWVNWFEFIGFPCSDLKACASQHEPRHCINCIACYPILIQHEMVGLIWVGEKFYPTTGHFLKEGAEQGFSRRIPAFPSGFEVGKSWVALGHPKAITSEPPAYQPARAGIFKVWKPERIEKIVTDTQSKDLLEMKKLTLQGITPVIVPDNDLDHQ